MSLIDNGPNGTATFGVMRFDVSYDDCIKESIEETAKKFHVSSQQSLDWDKYPWGQNVIASDQPVREALKLLEDTPEMYFPIIVAAAKEKVDKAFNKEFKPYDTYEKKGNIWVNTGRNEIMKLACGTGSPQAYNNATADLGVGNDATAPVDTHTALQGGSTLYKAMNATFPTAAASEQFDAQATFGDAEAKFDWLEEAFRNGSGDAVLWNRANDDLGDKTSVTETWILTATLTW